MKNLASIILLFLFSTCSILSAGEPGKVGFNFLKISAGARNAAMGEIGATFAGDLYSLFHNPAVAAATTQTQLGFMHHEYIFNIRHEFIGLLFSMGAGAASIKFDYFKVGNIERRNVPSSDPIGYFDSQDWVLSLGYAIELNNSLALGLTGKYAAEKIESVADDALLADLGGVYNVSEKLKLGAAVRNVGRKPRFGGEKIELPLTLAAGISLRTLNTLFATELVAAKHSDPSISVGAEKLISGALAFRSGYRSGVDNYNFSFGVGFTRNIWQFDYAFIPYKSDLGSNHRFSLTILIK